ncbi:D-alanyl-D-alanine carboxypeptidase/D-alanyl-D-alanine-endopeptidase [filamentous cyanobacterium CCP5]|nr:D-alanyl-D-alanine carboxypeptidase/D-alanyl-D-alanine-endopeptidase [filamentous cyanobacterium CCP5]
MALSSPCRIPRSTWSRRLRCRRFPLPPLVTGVAQPGRSGRALGILKRLALAAGWVGLLPSSVAALCEAQLGPAMETLATAPELRSARLGILLATEAGRDIYARDADQFFVPASNTKLFTTAAALDRLGPDFRFRTTVYGSGQPGLQPLVVVGGGDPSFSHDDLQALGDQLHVAGISQVSRLIGDDSYFPGSAYNPNWEWEDVQADYGAPVNSLILNGNAFEVVLSPGAAGEPLGVSWAEPTWAPTWAIENHGRTGARGSDSNTQVFRSWGRPALVVQGQLAADHGVDRWEIANPQPADYFVEQLAHTLEQSGIAVGSTTAASDRPPTEGLRALATVESAPLSELLVPTNQDSDNLYAEALLKGLGMATDPDALDATDAGIGAIVASVASLGVPAASFELVDGSGIARQNLATPRALVSVLQVMAHHPQRQVFLDSLAVAGVSGTLRNRLGGTVLAGNLRGKTGALTGNVSLTAYLMPPQSEALVVSILINHANVHASQLRRLIDQMLLQIAQLQGC